MSKPTHKVFGALWWDFDEKMRLGIECEHPPTDQYYLCFIPYEGKDASKAIEIAEIIIQALGRTSQ